MTGSPRDGKALKGQQTWAQPLGWPLSHQVCWVVSEMYRGVKVSEYDLAYQTPHFSEHLQSPSMYSDTLHSRLCRLHNNHTAPCIRTPTHATPCLFVYLFTFVIGAHVAFFVCLFPLPVVSDIDRQQANAKSDCACCIRRGLGRRLRSSLLLNLSPRCGLPCRVVYLMF